jgi:predicted PurR-regulated permease PerM
MSHPVVIALLIMAIVAAMSLAAEVLKPLALAVLLTFALTPLSAFFERLGLPRALAAALTVLLTLGAVVGFGYVVGRQVTSLAGHLEKYEHNIEKKLSSVRPGDDSAIEKTRRLVQELSRTIYRTPLESGGGGQGEGGQGSQVTSVRVIQEPTFRERLQTAVGPSLEVLGVGSFVLILVLFMMTSREDLRDRVVSLFGHHRVGLTTRTMDEIGRRISRYLVRFAAVNSAFGLVVGLGLWAIGLPFAVLWGCVAAVLRFFPYVGPAVAFALPLIFSFAYFPDWYHPLAVLALFAAVETALNSFLEPVIYGRTTGVSALGLLVAAMFWTWLWGLPGILLSTPLTVCLAVLGKYVPSLGVFATLLGEDAELRPDVRFYNRLVALDRDGAVDVVDEALKSRTKAGVFDDVLVPTLSRAQRDANDGHLEDRDLAFIRRVVEEVVEDLEEATDLPSGMPAPPANAVPNGDAAGPAAAATAVRRTAPAAGPEGSPVVIGVAAPDTGDAIALRMLAQLLATSGPSLELVTDSATPLDLAERLAERSPTMVVLSHLPPAGLTEARYKVRRLRARFRDLPILVGRWDPSGKAAMTAEQLAGISSSHVSFSLADARDEVVSRLMPGPAEDGLGRVLAEPVGGRVG